MEALPFFLRVPGRESLNLSEVSETTFKFRGVMRLEAEGIRLEWSGTAEVERVGLTAIGTETISLPREAVVVPYGRLLSVAYRRLWWPHVELTGNDLGALRLIPSEESGRVRCFVSWWNRAGARAFASAAERGRAAAPALPPGYETPIGSTPPEGYR